MMKPLSNKNQSKLNKRRSTNALRSLGTENNLIDFSSNDYLDFSKSTAIFDASHRYLVDNNMKQNGSTGSRLLSGNHKLYTDVEAMICEFHESEAALLFNSGYDANIGFFSSVPQRGDVILYDELIHASIRDGITMSTSKSYKFKHNDLDDLSELLKRVQYDEVYVVTEAVFSMDGDSPDLNAFTKFCSQNNCYLIVDEAHAIGVFGEKGYGMAQDSTIQDAIFARIVTFGKALGCHGGAILGSNELKQYLVNFARSFIYTTGLPPHSLATIQSSYKSLISSRGVENLRKLRENIVYFNSEIKRMKLDFIESNSAIHCCIIPGNKKVKIIAQQLRENNYDVKPILSPTVPTSQERLRFCLHSFNSKREIQEVINLLSTLVD